MRMPMRAKRNGAGIGQCSIAIVGSALSEGTRATSTGPSWIEGTTLKVVSRPFQP